MCNLIIFGASGDISSKKVFPGLYEWYNNDNKCLKTVIGYGRTSLTKKKFHKIINIDDTAFLKYFDYQTGQYDSYDSFVELKSMIDNCNISKGEKVLLYFGVPSYIVPNIIKNSILSNIDKDYDCRYILEKPIGNSLDNCIAILNNIRDMVNFNKIYILDHYLGKSSIRDMINDKTNHISDIKIYLNEIENVDHRLEYFDKVGLFKDMVQSHVMTLLLYCFPQLFNNNSTNNNSTNNIDSNIPNIIVEEHIKGQYNGYDGNKDIDTYLKLYIKWNNTDLMIEAGKGMSCNKKEIHYVCNNKDIIIQIGSKYSEYKCLFQDVLNADKSKFLSSDSIKYFWKISDHILEQNKNTKMLYYDKGIGI